jgi:glycine/D-amino acid oxidase-like deaminating enzyme
MQRKLDLRTGTPVWEAYRVPRIPTQKLTQDSQCDVLVVGLGISGAMLAEALTAEGLSVIGVDRRGAMLGSTAATTALVQFEIDQPLSELSRTIGASDAEQAWRRSRLAVTNLRGRVDEFGINCDMAARQSLYLAGNALGPSELRKEAEAPARRGHPRHLSAACGLEGEIRHSPQGCDPQPRQHRSRPEKADRRISRQGS